MRCNTVQSGIRTDVLGEPAPSHFDSDALKIRVLDCPERSVFIYQISVPYVPGGNHHNSSSERLGTSVRILMILIKDWDKDKGLFCNKTR